MFDIRPLTAFPFVLLSFALLIAFGEPLAADANPDQDLRFIETGHEIPDKSYCDQPYVVKLPDGSWLCTLTTGKDREGKPGQHVAATISKDQGKTWGPLIDIESETGPEASWAVPLIVPSGRVYAFYSYNGDKINSIPGETKKRADMLGWYCYKYSDDKGKTWSKRYRIPIRVTAADRANQWEGKVQVFWGIDKPKASEMGVTIAFTKLGRWMLENGEGWMLHSDNILTESDPEKINWRLLPDGDHGIRLEKFGSVQEEHNHVIIGKDRLYMVYRTTMGFPCHAYSDDSGRTWDKPQPMTYTPGGRKIKTPRACPKLFKCRNGKYLFWFHFNGTQTFGKIYDESLGSNRNPVWITGGVERDGKMHWSEPELLLYNDLEGRGMSYPDLIEQDGKYWVTETQKSVARVHEIDPTLLEGLWAQFEGNGEVTRKGLALSLDGKAVEAESVNMPQVPNLTKTNSGFTLDTWLKLENMASGQVILDSRDDKGKGIALMVEKDGALKLHFSDGTNPPGQWTSDPGLLKEGQRHHITAIVDGGPNIISFVVDGKLCNGGESRQFGWGRFDPKVTDVNGSDRLRLSPSFTGEILCLRVYDRYLRTSEAVGNWKADNGHKKRKNLYNNSLPQSNQDMRRSRVSAQILAQDFVTITRAPKQGRFWMNTPGIVALPSGNLLATAQIGDWSNVRKGWRTRILKSSDDGKTWSLVCEKPGYEASLMVAKDKLYMFVLPEMSEKVKWMGDNVSIVQSTDEGRTWTKPVELFEGPYWTLPMGKAIKGNTCYVGINVGTWEGGPNNGVAVMAGDLSKDLMDPKSWRLSNTVLRPGTPEGLTCKLMAQKVNVWRSWKRDGWLEPNVVNVNGRLRVMSRCVIDGYATANIGGICDLEDDGTTLKLSFAQYAAVPGGQCKFYIQFDPVSKMFWMASNLPTDSQEMVLDWEKLRANGRFNGGPGNERRILMLYYSIDALNWFPAGCIAKGEGMLQSFMYPTFDFQGDDIVLISRSSQEGHNQHDADTATFHRITNFRSLALDLFPH